MVRDLNSSLPASVINSGFGSGPGQASGIAARRAAEAGRRAASGQRFTSAAGRQIGVSGGPPQSGAGPSPGLPARPVWRCANASHYHTPGNSAYAHCQVTAASITILLSLTSFFTLGLFTFTPSSLLLTSPGSASTGRSASSGTASFHHWATAIRSTEHIYYLLPEHYLPLLWAAFVRRRRTASVWQLIVYRVYLHYSATPFTLPGCCGQRRQPGHRFVRALLISIALPAWHQDNNTAI